MQPLLIGIAGTVLALDRTTGQEVWRTPLKGGDFVNLTVVGEQVLATTRGEIFCLDKNGAILWHNPLKGLGHGLVTVATGVGLIQAAVCAEKLRQDAQIASAAAGAGGAAG
jgi:outer membrane protein assembly factor BamB